MLKNIVIKWAVKQIVKDGTGNYAQMRYLEDVVENQFGEKQFIFKHTLVPINQKTLAKQQAAGADAKKMADKLNERLAELENNNGL